MKNLLILFALLFPIEAHTQFWNPLTWFKSSTIKIQWDHQELNSYLIYKEIGQEYKFRKLEATDNEFVFERKILEGYEDFLILPYNGRLTKKSKILKDEVLNVNLEIEIGVFGVPELSNDEKNKINAGLRKLYTGIQASFKFVGDETIPELDLRNKGSIVENLTNRSYIDERLDYHIFLDDLATFPSDGSCQAQVISEFANEDAEELENVILSNTSLFNNIFLVIHEICHFFEGNDHNYQSVYKHPNTQKKYLDIMSANPYYCRYTHSFNNLKTIHLGVAFEECTLNFYPLVKDSNNIQCELPIIFDCDLNPTECGDYTVISRMIQESEFMIADFLEALRKMAEIQYDIYFTDVSKHKQKHIENLISHTEENIRLNLVKNLHLKTKKTKKELFELDKSNLIKEYALHNEFKVPVYDQQNNLIKSKTIEIDGKYFQTDKFGYITTKLSSKSNFEFNISKKNIHSLDKFNVEQKRILNLKEY